MSAVERRLGMGGSNMEKFQPMLKEVSSKKKNPVNPEAIVRRLSGGRNTLPVGGLMPIGGKKGPSRNMFQRKTK